MARPAGRPSTRFPSRPSSSHLQRILAVHRSSIDGRNQSPLRVWPDDNDGGGPLTLAHPLLRAFYSCPSSAARPLDQLLARLFLSGLASHPLAAGRAIKKLASLPSSLPRALSYFASLPSPDSFVANTLLRSLLSSAGAAQALAFYRCLVVPKHLLPNHFTFPLLAKLLAALGRPRDGRAIHALAVHSGLAQHLFTKNSLIHMYSSFGDVRSAHQLFGSGAERDVVTWNSIIDACVKNGAVADARKLFDEMPERDLISWNSMIAGHAGAGDMAAAAELFLEMPWKDAVSWNSMIDGYARIGEVGLARELFDKMPTRTLVSWNVVLALYARTKDYRECLKLFDAMMEVGDVRPDEATLVSVLTACANLGELNRGKWVHSLMKDGKTLTEPDVLLLTSLLNMYAKCGAMGSAREIFDQMEERSVVSWNSMIIGYGMHGQSDKAFEMFLKMDKTGPQPNETTFVCVLSACAHGGMVLEGWWCYDRMIHSYGIKPEVEHLGCMVDLLGRAGLLRDTEELVKKMPVEPAPALWGALLSASRTHSNRELGEIVGRKLIELDPKDVGSYLLLSNIYAAEGRWDDVEKVRMMMRENGLQKASGVSLVTIEEKISDNKKCMMYSFLREMGGYLKLPCRKFDVQQINIGAQ